MYVPLSAGCLDGQSLIEMNNLGVGYFPPSRQDHGIGVYPAPTPASDPAHHVVQVPEPGQVPAGPQTGITVGASGTSS
jgi:hypothetical protein